MNPGHELLLPAYLDGPRELTDYVRKPLFGREGKGIVVFEKGCSATDSAIAGSCVYQQIASLASADGKTAVLGSWLIDGQPAGIGIRESSGMVTTNTSRFVPASVSVTPDLLRAGCM